MARIHFFELEDQSWFPASLRNWGTDFLKILATKIGMFTPAIPLIKEVLYKTREHHIIDIASGAGGSMLSIAKKLKQEIPDLKITLTDYYPNIPAYKETVRQSPEIFSYIEFPVDARKVPPTLKGLRTHFLSLHHFKPEMAKEIIQNAVEDGAPVAFFEGQERSVQNFLAIALSPISLFLLTPFIRPFSRGRFFFTYFVPVMPLFVLWDGFVSCLRTYTVPEMQQLIAEVPGSHLYDWKVGRLKNGPGILLYLIGTKKEDYTSTAKDQLSAKHTS